MGRNETESREEGEIPRGCGKVGKLGETGSVASFPLPTPGAGPGRGAGAPGTGRPWAANPGAGERLGAHSPHAEPLPPAARRHGRVPHPRCLAGRPGGQQPAAAGRVRGDHAARPGQPGNCPERVWKPPRTRSCCPAVAGAENRQGGLAGGWGNLRVSACKRGQSSEDTGHIEIGHGDREGLYSLFVHFFLI